MRLAASFTGAFLQDFQLDVRFEAGSVSLSLTRKASYPTFVTISLDTFWVSSLEQPRGSKHPDSAYIDPKVGI